MRTEAKKHRQLQPEFGKPHRDETMERRIRVMYQAVPLFIREDICEASAWARNTLTDLEGKGHHFTLTADNEGLVACAFAKPAWPGDHCGRGMPEGAEAIVMAVCEYLCGA